MKKVTYWIEDDDSLERKKFLESIESLDHLLISYLSLEPHAFLHAGILLQKHRASFENNDILSIGLDVCKEIILLKANPSSITVVDTDEAAIESARSLANRIIKNQQIEYVVGDASNLDIEQSYDTVLLSQMDYCLDDEVYSSLLAQFSQLNIEEVIILTPSLYEFSINPCKTLEALEFFLGAIKRAVFRQRFSFATYRRRKSYFESIISNEYKIADHFDYKYPSGREHLYRLVNRQKRK